MAVVLKKNKKQQDQTFTQVAKQCWPLQTAPPVSECYSPASKYALVHSKKSQGLKRHKLHTTDFFLADGFQNTAETMNVIEGHNLK